MKLLLVDDQSEFRSGLRDLLSTVDGLEVVGEASNGREAVKAALSLRPDITLMDVRMPVMDGIHAIAAIRKEWPDACILVVTTFDDDRLIEQSISVGAAGYVLKGTPVDDMVPILRLALRGYVAIGRRTLPRNANDIDGEYLEALNRAKHLTQREQEILTLIARGQTNRDIAKKLFITEGTVKNYVSNILAALGVRHRTEAALLWRTMGAAGAVEER